MVAVFSRALTDTEVAALCRLDVSTSRQLLMVFNLTHKVSRDLQLASRGDPHKDVNFRPEWGHRF
jgi:hypothetical protein